MVFSARGDIFTVPIKNGPIRNLTNSSNAHDRSVAWSPDGSVIAYISDETGEDEIYIQKSDGSEKKIQLTFNSKNYKYDPVWSPDGTMLVYSDRNQKLYLIDVKAKKKSKFLCPMFLRSEITNGHRIVALCALQTQSERENLL